LGESYTGFLEVPLIGIGENFNQKERIEILFGLKVIRSLGVYQELFYMGLLGQGWLKNSWD
jgi:hypothetical protein